MSPLSIYLPKNEAPEMVFAAGNTTWPVSTLSPKRRVVDSLPTPSHPMLVHISSGLSFSDDDEEDWKRELSSMNSPQNRSVPSPPPPPPLPLSSIDEARDSASAASTSENVPLERLISSRALNSYKSLSPPVESTRLRSPTESTTPTTSPGGICKASHRRLHSFTEQEMQEVGDLQESADFQKICSPLPGHWRSPASVAIRPNMSPSSGGRLPSLVGGSSLVRDLVSLTAKLQRRRKKYGTFHVKVGLLWNHIGNYHFRRQNFEKALAAYRESLECREGSSNPAEQEHLASAYSNIGTALWSVGHPDQSITPLRRAEQMRISVELAQGRDPDQSLAVADCQHQLGMALCLVHDYKAALCFLRKALFVRQRMAGSKSVLVAFSLDAIGKLFFLRGDFDEAMSHHKEALSVKESTLKKDSPTVWASMKNIAVVQEASGDYDGALNSLSMVAHAQKIRLVQSLSSPMVGSKADTVLHARQVGDTLQNIARVHYAKNGFIATNATKDIVCQAIRAYRDAGIDGDDPTIVALRAFASRP